MFTLNSRFLTQNLTGVQRYAYELFKQINKRTEDASYVLPAQPVIDKYEIPEGLKLQKTGKYKSHVWEQLELPAYLNKLAKKPLLLNLCNTAPLFYKNQIVTVHDIAYMRGNWHSRSFRSLYKVIIPTVLKNSKHVITVSEFSKAEIMDAYKIAGDKISVVYNAGFSAPDIEKSDRGDLELKYPYILSVGSIDPRKNLKRLIKAFLNLKQTDFTLYLTGAYNANFKTDPELDVLLKNNEERIVFLGYRTDAELIYLYQNALCFAYPSLYEGFGLPPVEAMAAGCPVITSGITSLPEICGSAALYCDPLNIPDITSKMDNMIEDSYLRENLIAQGYENAGKYSWQLSGKLLMDVINNYI
ncbi:glycosyltransferase family 4 protein [Mucilaginibacter gilvus]|uniref:Glycosyltransferase family 1 protein n=1 Tax=Mucilaginibacter gilvus TaxID=2305909 RepID=A0A444MLM7_9SPHI|nr:glycosyltransferase family 1 protein [Mucilaginibacter gilvus]RWY50198.1 glycosyltransferase family 1 protein [Mucilaginibacter gilvus]